MKRLLISILLLMGASLIAYAQSPIVTKPFQSAVISPASPTIGSTNTFQNLFPSSINTITGRVDCIIQNQAAANKMFIFFGLAPAATTPNSLQLSAGSTFRCANSGVVIKDAISITGTANDTFFAAQE